jgi:hypothetical protein
MKFPQQCREASALLQQLSQLADTLEQSLLRLEDVRDEDATTLLTLLVQGLLDANRLSEDILHEHIPIISQEETAVGEAIHIAHTELARRIWGVRQDFEVMTKVSAAKKRRQQRQQQLPRAC